MSRWSGVASLSGFDQMSLRHTSTVCKPFRERDLRKGENWTALDLQGLGRAPMAVRAVGALARHRVQSILGRAFADACLVLTSFCFPVFCAAALIAVLQFFPEQAAPYVQSIFQNAA